MSSVSNLSSQPHPQSGWFSPHQRWLVLTSPVTVFIDLARKSAALADRTVLGGWLFRSAQFIAIDVVRAERRRRTREAEAQSMQEANQDAPPSGEWEKLRPLLDDAVGALGTRERDTLVLRFFEGRAWAEIGERLQVSEAAARMRGERALEKLRRLLAKRGITSTSTALGAVLIQQVEAVPSELVVSVVAKAVNAVSMAAPMAGLGALSFMASTKLVLGLCGLAGGAIGVAVVQYRAAQSAGAEAATLRAAHASLQARIGKLEQDLTQAAQRAHSSDADTATLLEAITAARTPNAMPPAGAGGSVELTVASVQARFKAARELATAGKSAAALAEFLWCLDEGMVKISALSGIRASTLGTELQKLAQTFPPAAAALRQRRDATEQMMAEAPKERKPAADFALLNRILGEEDKTLAAFDRFPPGDARRTHLAADPQMVSRLVEVKRYAEVMEVYPYAQMSGMLSLSMKMPNVTGHPDPEAGLRRYRNGVLETSARNFEVLVGAGDLKNARVFAQQVLLFDDTASTRALLENHAARAGKTGFVEGLGK